MSPESVIQLLDKMKHIFEENMFGLCAQSLRPYISRRASGHPMKQLTGFGNVVFRDEHIGHNEGKKICMRVRMEKEALAMEWKAYRLLLARLALDDIQDQIPLLVDMLENEYEECWNSFKSKVKKLNLLNGRTAFEKKFRKGNAIQNPYKLYFDGVNGYCGTRWTDFE